MTGLWIGIDGIDCTGKTTCLEFIRTNSGFQPIQVFDEFTYSPMGDLIRGLISQNRFFSLTVPPSSRWADTMLIFSDWMLKMETSSLGEGKPLYLSDRTFLSAVAYQVVRLHEQYASVPRRDLLDIFRTLALLARRSIPTLHFEDILLTIDESELQRRVVGRGEPALSSAEVSFLMEAQTIMVELAPTHCIDVSRLSVGELLVSVTRFIQDSQKRQQELQANAQT